jgi:hypothetical protein
MSRGDSGRLWTVDPGSRLLHRPLGALMEGSHAVVLETAALVEAAAIVIYNVHFARPYLFVSKFRSSGGMN